MSGREITIKLDDLLSLIACAETYGHTNGVISDAFAGWLDGKLSDEEIEAYAASFLTPEMRANRYSEEDADAVRASLRNFRDSRPMRSRAGR